VGVGVWQPQVDVGVGDGVWQWHRPDGDGDCPFRPVAETAALTLAADCGVACAAVAPSSSIPTPRAKQHARIRMRLGISRSFSLDHSIRSYRVARQSRQPIALPPGAS
jgi:hypothetical protein